MAQERLARGPEARQAQPDADARQGNPYVHDHMSSNVLASHDESNRYMISDPERLADKSMHNLSRRAIERIQAKNMMHQRQIPDMRPNAARSVVLQTQLSSVKNSNGSPGKVAAIQTGPPGSTRSKATAGLRYVDHESHDGDESKYIDRAHQPHPSAIPEHHDYEAGASDFSLPRNYS